MARKRQRFGRSRPAPAEPRPGRVEAKHGIATYLTAMKSNYHQLRILFEGERWLGSNSASAARALRRLGPNVMDLDFNTYVPTQWTGFGLRAARKLLLPLMIKEYNRDMLKLARGFRPHLFLAFKGTFVLPETLREMRAMGISLYNFFPDVSVFEQPSKSLPYALQEYDCVFSTKSFTSDDLEKKGFPLRHYEHLAHGYDPEVHQPVSILADEQDIYGADAAFIGLYSPAKERTLAGLKRLLPELDLAVWGNGWHLSTAPGLKGSIRKRPLLGLEYAKGLCAAKIALALLSERRPGASSGDLVTSRTFNIPATGAFMIHERSGELLEYYEEGREIECFSSVEELAEKTRFYLAHPDKRKAIAEAGYQRCVPAYSQDNRMRKILEWHEKRGKA